MTAALERDGEATWAHSRDWLVTFQIIVGDSSWFLWSLVRLDPLWHMRETKKTYENSDTILRRPWWLRLVVLCACEWVQLWSSMSVFRPEDWSVIKNARKVVFLSSRTLLIFVLVAHFEVGVSLDVLFEWQQLKTRTKILRLLQEDEDYPTVR